MSGAPRRPRRLRRAELPSDTVALARWLIGKLVVRELGGERVSGRAIGRAIGRIVETEAYLVGDEACHAFRGPTARNASLFLERGHAYVYLCYGTSYLLNVSSEARGVGAGVLLRALEPLEGLEAMRELRGVARALDLARGPGRLAQALAVDLSHDGLDLCAPGPLWLAEAPRPRRIGRSVRIGITRDAERVLRFFEPGNPHVSGPRALSAPERR